MKAYITVSFGEPKEKIKDITRGIADAVIEYEELKDIVPALKSFGA